MTKTDIKMFETCFKYAKFGLTTNTMLFLVSKTKNKTLKR